MSKNKTVIIATGTNLGDKLKNLQMAKSELSGSFTLKAESQIYCSKAVDYLDQPDFYNQVLEFDDPHDRAPEKILEELLSIESKLGRMRSVPRGPRVIDIDLLFVNFLKIATKNLELPHPRLWQRSFVVEPLQELPFFQELTRVYSFNHQFDTPATPVNLT